MNHEYTFMDTETQLSVPKPRGNRPQRVVQNGTLVIVVQAERKMRKLLINRQITA